MLRKLPVQYEGAIYHVMSRGDHREEIFHDDEDRQLFLKSDTAQNSINSLDLIRRITHPNTNPMFVCALSALSMMQPSCPRFSIWKTGRWEQRSDFSMSAK